MAESRNSDKFVEMNEHPGTHGKVLKIGRKDVIDFLLGKIRLVGIPDGAKLGNAFLDETTPDVGLAVYHESFPVVSHECELPRVDACFEVFHSGEQVDEYRKTAAEQWHQIFELAALKASDMTSIVKTVLSRSKHGGNNQTENRTDADTNADPTAAAE